MNINAKQRAIQFAELHGQRLIVRRTVRSRDKNDKSYIKEVLVTIPNGDPIPLYTHSKRKPYPKWVKIWARAIEVLGPVTSFEVPTVND